jgi:HEAT repeat protein
MSVGNKHWFVLLLLFIEACDRSGDPVLARIDELRNADNRIRRKAAEELGKLGDARAVPALIACLGDPDWEVHKREFSASLLKGIGAKAEEELGKIGDARAVPPPAPPNWEVRKSAINALVQIGKPAVRPLIIYHKEQQDIVVSRGNVSGIFANPAGVDAVEALRKMGKAAVEPLIAILKDRDPHLRRFAASMLGNIGDVRAVR